MEAPARTRRTRFGAFEVDLRSGELYKDGIRLKLQDQPFQVLALLLEHPGDVVTREELRQKLWPADTFIDFDTGVNSAIKKLRDVLSDSAERPRYIETLPRRGYRFIAPLAEITPSAPLPLPTPSEVSSGDKIAQVGPMDLPALSVTTRARFSFFRSPVFLGLALLVLGTCGLVFYLSNVAKHASRPAIRSLAVLPLQNLSGDPTQQYLADGMTEELIGSLSGIHDLRVISRTSVMRFKDSKLSVQEIAKTLGVDALVEGSVIREGNRIRVHAQLIRAATDEHFWSEAYDRDVRGVLALESDVAQAIAQKVEVTVTGEEHSRLVATRNVSPEVYESYLKGRFTKINTRAEVEQSIAYYQDAIDKDPTFAPAYVGLAASYNSLAGVFRGVPPSEVRPKVLNAVQKALELDPDIAQAHAILAHVYVEQLQWSAARAEYKRALELNPNDSAAQRGLATWLMCQGHMDEALAWSRRAREVDPLVRHPGTGQILYYARRYDEAIRELRTVLAVRPDDAAVLWLFGLVLLSNHQAQEAIPVLEKAASLSDRSPGVVGVLVQAYDEAGRRADALRCLDELKRRLKTGYVPPAAFVLAYLGLGERDQALAWFERGYQEQAGFLMFLKIEPLFDPVRDDPRFKDLLHRAGLDQPL
jgi:TolB-like protein/DNA-binding winged helix-turn-helix (wHTH) protein/tetratricopeptide (TPR) repeat protein